jgi:hypothetical protein
MPTQRKPRPAAPAEPTPEEQAQTEGPSREEAELAAAQENQAYMAAQLGYLQQRVAGLRIELNRALARVAELEDTKESA